jgi:hypothetical protein
MVRMDEQEIKALLSKVKSISRKNIKKPNNSKPKKSEKNQVVARPKQLINL